MVDCAIVGGGVAGLAAAVDLSIHGHTLRLIEERPRSGGRARSFIDPATSDVLDNGQHLIMGCYSAFFELLRRIGVPEELRRTRPMNILFRDASGKRARLALPPGPFRLSLAAAILRFDLLSIRERLSILRFARELERLDAERLDELDRITVAEWLREHGQSERSMAFFWNVIALATLNTDGRDGSAKLFAVVLREVFLGGASASRVLIPPTGLSELYVDPALKFIEKFGGEVIHHDGAEGVHREEGSGFRVTLKSGKIVESRAVITAIPSDRLSDKLEVNAGNGLQLKGLYDFDASEIHSYYLWIDRRIFREPMTACLGGRLQWLFAKGRGKEGSWLYAGVVSDADGSMEESEGSIVEELTRLFPGLREENIRRIRMIRERRATFRAKPGLEPFRPPARTAVPGFFLAGDWTATHLPATIEGAARSGFAAAECAREFLAARKG